AVDLPRPIDLPFPIVMPSELRQRAADDRMDQRVVRIDDERLPAGAHRVLERFIRLFLVPGSPAPGVAEIRPENVVLRLQGDRFLEIVRRSRVMAEEVVAR